MIEFVYCNLNDADRDTLLFILCNHTQIIDTEKAIIAEIAQDPDPCAYILWK